jgi:HD-GYP domain-containing protein (c-di-GMP phosphodiesterase class II)
MSQQSTSPLPRATKWFSIALFLSAAVSLVLLCGRTDIRSLDWRVVAFWSALVFLPEFFSVPLPRGGSYITVTTATEFGSILVLGASLTAFLVFFRTIIDYVFVRRLLSKSRKHVYTICFNSGQYVATILLTGWALQSARSPGSSLLFQAALPWLLGGATYFLANSLLNSLWSKTFSAIPLIRIWWDNFGGKTAVSYAGLTLIGYFMAADFQGTRPQGLAAALMFAILWLVRDRYRDQLTIWLSDDESLAMIASSLEARDSSTDMHSECVAEISLLIGQEARLDWNRLETLRRAARTHDLGKVATKDHILFEGQQLSAEEYRLFKSHPVISEQILVRRKSLKREARIARHHHENYDGSGYPDGLKGEEIPLEARILRVADSFHAMISPRPYRRPHTKAEALLELLTYSNRQFDPQVVRWFLEALYKQDPELREEVDLLLKESEEKKAAARLAGLPDCFSDYRCIEICQKCPWVAECNQQTREALDRQALGKVPAFR